MGHVLRERRGLRGALFAGLARHPHGCRVEQPGFPREAAARVAVTTIGSHLEEQQPPELVIFVCFDTATFNAYRNAVDYGAQE